MFKQPNCGRQIRGSGCSIPGFPDRRGVELSRRTDDRRKSTLMSAKFLQVALDDHQQSHRRQLKKAQDEIELQKAVIGKLKMDVQNLTDAGELRQSEAFEELDKTLKRKVEKLEEKMTEDQTLMEVVEKDFCAKLRKTAIEIQDKVRLRAYCVQQLLQVAADLEVMKKVCDLYLQHPLRS